MAIPDFQSIMLPLLHRCADGQEHSKRDIVPALAAEFGLTQADLEELLPTGRQGKFDNRVGRAKSCLKQAGLLETTGRGLFMITDRGRPEIQKFVGALAGNKASKAVFITTSGFTKEARVYAGQVNSKLGPIDGTMLAELMIDYNIGVSTRETYEIKRVDSDYFAED